MKRSISHVPVFVDTTEPIQEVARTRCTYFYIECAEPGATIYQTGDADLPILLVDLEGVIVSGLGDQEYLDTPEAVGELFDFIAEKTPYVVSTGYLWLPNELLRDYTKTGLTRGDVLRVYMPLFIEARTLGEISQDIAAKDVPDDVRAVYFSESETVAFREWTGQTVERIKKRYREQPEMNLRERHKRRNS